MALITVLLSLVIEHYLGTLEEFRRYHWFDRFCDGINRTLPDGLRASPLPVLAALLLPVLVVAVAAALLSAVWLVLGFAFGLAVLLYCIGSQDMEAQVEAYADARVRGDEESARWHVAELMGSQAPVDSAQMSRAVMETSLVSVNERLLAVVFWFALLGPAGAILYRLSALLRERSAGLDENAALWARRINYALDWIPARLTALGFALAGSFIDAVQYWRDEAGKWRDANRGVLIAAGFGALQYGFIETTSADAEIRDLRATVALVRRTVVVWVAALALITIAGWNG